MTRRAKRLSSIEMGHVVHEAYAVHYLMFNLGFEPSEVYCGAQLVQSWTPPGIHAVVTLKAQGKEYVYVVWPLIREDVPRFERYWREFSLQQPEMSETQKDLIIAGSQAMKAFGALARSIADKGFVVPAELLEKFTSFDWVTSGEPADDLAEKPPRDPKDVN